MPDPFLLAAQAAAMLTPELFGGAAAIKSAARASTLKVDGQLLERGAGPFADRAYALLIQSITDPCTAEAMTVKSGQTLTPGRLLPALDRRKRRALSKLLLAAPTTWQH
ncbi:hypothetical protein H8Z72_22605 (plasmid) [Xanthomonas citri pv. citri]|nr:hypothetical protein [Xanthomonas citri]QRD62678.1 hypothetical protein H8Z74_23580 [Xanthomonas citri pv. citri]QRD67213.1 hypothetical protein H8Z73_22560 [Xanthomonas citri pv. citri]QRD71742.1 hypothetical protein H8Z72_22605 [Xanthomonas citri pv. citri]